MASGKHCIFAAATGIIYYMTRSRNCGLQKIPGGNWRFPGGVPPPETCLAETLPVTHAQTWVSYSALYLCILPIQKTFSILL